MKLAEALQERADLNRKIEELRRRLANVILVQEGEEPAEEPAELLKELNAREHITQIIVTHDPTVAEQTNRIIRIKDGVIE